MFFAIVWTIWEFRNRKIFEDSVPILSLAVDLIRFCVAWWFKHYGSGSSDSITILSQNLEEFCRDPVKSKKNVVVHWVPPVLGVLKFNVDGSVRYQSGMAGIGGVLRDSNGMVLCFFSLSVGVQDVIAAELMAIKKACSLCVLNSALMGKFIEIVSDSLVVVTWINSDNVGSLDYVNLVYDIRDLMGRHGNLSLVFCSRASNTFADDLAKGSNLMGNVVHWGSI